jgi:hypothetical protein
LDVEGLDKFSYRNVEFRGSEYNSTSEEIRGSGTAFSNEANSTSEMDITNSNGNSGQIRFVNGTSMCSGKRP